MSTYPRIKTIGETDWFVHDRFGMFIHFGLYALPARHEWIKEREKISEEKYQKYFDHFNPDLMDARDWARQAKAAGMKYAVLTAKHHEGFCLFDSQYTDYKSTNTPCGRDLVREFVDAFRAEGLKVGFYYSLIDWHHPDFPIDRKHPRRLDPDAEAQDKGRDMKKYAEYMRNQVTELLTNYGKIDILWFDFSYPAGTGGGDVFDWMQYGGGKGPEQWEADKMLALIRKLQPHIILNDRLGIPQDLVTPEQSNYNLFKIPQDENGNYVTWETCQTFSGSWGYFRDEESWKTPKMLIDMLIRSVARGGNLIMNVGPTSRGYFDSRAEDALKVYGDWIKYNGRSIYGCTMAEDSFEVPPGVELTQSEDGTRLYIHLLDFPFHRLVVKGLEDRIDYMQLLSDGSEIYQYETRYPHGPDGAPMDPQFTIFMPGSVFHTVDPVIEVFLKPKN
ncbi:MAG: alpha-L-fucosidase [Clostridia bacterium]|nr:alpha-L-fucosidase [Clostridia bacterium]